MPRPGAGAWLVPAFVAFGVTWGAWQALLPDLVGAANVGSGALGALLSLGFAAGFPAMLAAGQLRDKWGTAPVAALTAAGLGTALLAVAILPRLPSLAVWVVLLVAASGAYDVVINAAAMADAAWTRPARLTLLHAGFSAGGLVGALAAAGLHATDASFRVGYVVAALGLLVVAATAPLVRWPPGERVPPMVRGRLALGAVAPLALLAALAFVAEGSIETWSAIYLRLDLGAAAAVGALGPAAFHAAMFVGRLAGSGFAALAGPRRTLVGAGVGLCIGMLLALGAGSAELAIPAMGLAALGVSFVVPVTLSLAAKRASGRAGQVAAGVMTLGYGGFLLGPPLIGLVAELAGLRTALLLIPAAGALIAVAGARTARRASAA